MNAPINVGKFGAREKPRRGRSATAAMSAHLDKVASQVRACLRSEAASIVTQQFLAGRQVAAVQEDTKYGEAGVRKLAIKLKLPWKFLLRLSARARAFSAEAVTAAIATATANNYVLSISIFDELVSVDDANDRQCFLEDAIGGKWTVRKLRAQVRGPKPSPSVSRLPLPRVIGCAEALIDALSRVQLNTDGIQDSDDRERVLATLVKLTVAVNDATQRLVSGAGIPATHAAPTVAP